MFSLIYMGGTRVMQLFAFSIFLLLVLSMERSDTANASRKAAFEKIIEDARVENTFFIPPLHLPIHRHRPFQSRSPSSSLPTPPQQHQTVNDNSPAPPPPHSSPDPSPTSSVPPPENSLLSPPPPPSAASPQPAAKPTQEFARVHSSSSSPPPENSLLSPPPPRSPQPAAKPTQEFTRVHSSSSSPSPSPKLADHREEDSPPLPTPLTHRGDDQATQDRFLESVVEDTFEDVDFEYQGLTDEQWDKLFWSPAGGPLTGDVGLLPPAAAAAPPSSSSPSSKSSSPPLP